MVFFSVVFKITLPIPDDNKTGLTKCLYYKLCDLKNLSFSHVLKTCAICQQVNIQLSSPKGLLHPSSMHISEI